MSKKQRIIEVVCEKCGARAQQYESAEMFHFGCPSRPPGKSGVIPRYRPVATKGDE